jgi:8-amino-7-oxononanoate synthase
MDGLQFLVTDTVFSMDGDVADLRAACDAAEAGGGLVVTDEAHATGVLGETGAGLAEMQNENRVAVSIGTLSKALGSVGGFACGPRAVIDTLINAARPFIYTTALPASASAAAMKSIELICRDKSRRDRVLKLAAHVKRELESLGFSCGNSITPIIPVMMKDSASALTAAAFLKDRGIWVPAIRPPTVKEARLRISLMSTHTDLHIEKLIQTMREIAAR